MIIKNILLWNASIDYIYVGNEQKIISTRKKNRVSMWWSRIGRNVWEQCMQNYPWPSMLVFRNHLDVAKHPGLLHWTVLDYGSKLKLQIGLWDTAVCSRNGFMFTLPYSAQISSTLNLSFKFRNIEVLIFHM